MTIQLSPSEQALWNKLRHRQDYAISGLYSTVYGKQSCPPRVQQMRVGAIVWRINAKLARAGIRQRIRPGVERRTYRLIRLRQE